METLIVVGFMATTLLVLVLAAVLLRLAEKASPRLSRFLDRHVGPENDPW